MGFERFHFKSGDNQQVIPADTLVDAIEWVRNYNKAPVDDYDWILDQDAYNMVRKEHVHFHDGTVARIDEDGSVHRFDTVKDIRVEFFKRDFTYREAFIDRFKPRFHYIFADGWDPDLAKPEKDQIVIGQTYDALCNNGEFCQKVIALDETHDAEKNPGFVAAYDELSRQPGFEQQKYAWVHDVDLDESYASFVQIERLRKVRPGLKFTGIYASEGNRFLIPAETLKEAISWADNLHDDGPRDGDRILDKSQYEMMMPGNLSFANLEVACFTENKWVEIDIEKKLQDDFLYTPPEDREKFIARFKPRFHYTFSEIRQSEAEHSNEIPDMVPD